MNRTLPPIQEQGSGDPEWLRRMRGWEKTPDWLRELIRADEPEPGFAAMDDLADSAPYVASSDDAALDLSSQADLEAQEDFDDTADLLAAITSADAQETERLELAQPIAFEAPDLSVVSLDQEEDDLDWLESIETSQSPAAEEEETDSLLSPAVEDDDIPDWLESIETSQPPTAEEEETDSLLSPAVEGDDIPDWLQRMSPVAEAEASPVESAPLPATEDRDIPDWLRDLAPVGPEEAEEAIETPDWLSELDGTAKTDLEGAQAEAIGAAPEPESSPQDEPEMVDGADAPEWLLDLAQAPEGELESETAPFLAEQEDLPEWLRPVKEAAPESLASDELAPEPEPLASDELAAEPEPLALDESTPEPGEPLLAEEGEAFPEWLVDMAGEGPPEPEVGELADELDALAMPTASALPTIEDILGETPEEPPEGEPPEGEPDAAAWLYKVKEEAPSQEPLLEFADGELLSGEMPEWVDELRVPEPEATEAESFVETSGPLAGLRGVINPDTLFALTAASKYAATPPVPDVQQERARLLRKFLAAPSKRPEIVPVSRGRVVMQRLGRWAIYAALLAAICAGIFVPALQRLIQPPQMAETEAFYDAVNGLPSGSSVLLVVDYDASYDGELTPQTRAILWHLMNKELGTIIVSHTSQGAAIVEDLVRDDLLRSLGKTYVPGQHYLNLGYMPPHMALLQAFMADPLGGATLWGTARTEAAQTPLGQRVAQFDDLGLIVLVSSSQEHVRWWVEQVAISGVQAEIVAGVSASAASYLLPYTAGGGQIAGALIGLGGAAEYEQLAGAQFWPNARENTVLLGCAQLLLAAIVLASGVRSLFGRSKGRT